MEGEPAAQATTQSPPRGIALRFADAVDRLNGFIGHSVAWLVVLMVLIGTFNAVARYVGRYIGINLSSNVYLELQWYLFSLIFLLGAAFALREDAHIRVDVLFANLSERAKTWINLLGTVLLLLPFCIFTLWVSFPAVRSSFMIREGSPDPGGLVRYPLKAVILISFVLLILQGVAEFIKELHKLRNGGQK